MLWVLLHSNSISQTTTPHRHSLNTNAHSTKMLFSTPLLVAIAGFAVSVFAEPPPGFAYDENCEAESE